jgi:hypothetical protein
VSEDSTSRKKPTWVDDKFKPVQTGDLDDLALLPGELRAFRTEMRGALELLTERILPTLDRINNAIQEIDWRVRRLESDRDEHRNALAEIRQTLAKRAKRVRARK